MARLLILGQRVPLACLFELSRSFVQLERIFQCGGVVEERIEFPRNLEIFAVPEL